MRGFLPRVGSGSPEYVYMIRASFSGAVKIGWTSCDPESRVRMFQIWSPEELTLIRLVPGNRRLEPMFHFYFREHHLRGEWFQFCQEMLTVSPEEVVSAGNGGRGVPLVFSRWKARTMTKDVASALWPPPPAPPDSEAAPE